MIDPINEHMRAVIDKREADLNKEAANTRLMGEKEFFDIMKTNNRHLTMEERYLLANIVNAFTEARKRDEAEGAI